MSSKFLEYVFLILTEIEIIKNGFYNFPSIRSRKQGCPFFVRGKLDEEINKVEVTKKCLLHNHHLGDIDMIPQAQHAGINNFLNIVVELPENGLAHEAPIEENVTVDDDSRKVILLFYY